MACMVKKLLCFIFPLIFLTSCVSTEHIENKDIEDKATLMMECIVNKDADELAAFYNTEMKENYYSETVKEIKQLFDYIDGSIVSYDYNGKGGGEETTHDGKVVYCNCYPEYDFTTNTNKEYTLRFSYHYIWDEHPEYEGINMISICENGNWSNKLVIGRNYYND